MFIKIYLLPLHCFYSLISSLVQMKKIRYTAQRYNRHGKRIWELTVRTQSMRQLVTEVRSFHLSTIDTEWANSLLKDCPIYCLMFNIISGFYLSILLVYPIYLVYLIYLVYSIASRKKLFL